MAGEGRRLIGDPRTRLICVPGVALILGPASARLMSSGLMISSIRSHREDWPPSGPTSTRNEILPSASGLIVIDASTIPGISGSTILPPLRGAALARLRCRPRGRMGGTASPWGLARILKRLQMSIHPCFLAHSSMLSRTWRICWPVSVGALASRSSVSSWLNSCPREHVTHWFVVGNVVPAGCLFAARSLRIRSLQRPGRPRRQRPPGPPQTAALRTRQSFDAGLGEVTEPSSRSGSSGMLRAANAFRPRSPAMTLNSIRMPGLSSSESPSYTDACRKTSSPPSSAAIKP